MDQSCFFIGHRDAGEELLPLLAEAVERHIRQYGVTDFFVGRYGRFDALAAKAVKEAKKRHPEVTLTLVLPYHPALRPVASPPGFDATYYPWENEHIPKRLAILKTNQRMVDTWRSSDRLCLSLSGRFRTDRCIRPQAGGKGPDPCYQPGTAAFCHIKEAHPESA